jgi:hypothetical protein
VISERSTCTLMSVVVRALVVALALTRSLEAQQPQWRLVYAVDSLGKRVSGDKSQLLAAVRAGQPVRVGWGISWRLPDGTPGGVEHVAEAAFLTIHHGEVFAQLPPILGQAPNGREPVISFSTEGDRLWYALLDTTGRLLGYFTGGREAPRTVRTATYWFVSGSGGTGPARLY